MACDWATVQTGYRESGGDLRQSRVDSLNIKHGCFGCHWHGNKPSPPPLSLSAWLCVHRPLMLPEPLSLFIQDDFETLHHIRRIFAPLWWGVTNAMMMKVETIILRYLCPPIRLVLNESDTWLMTRSRVKTRPGWGFFRCVRQHV